MTVEALKSELVTPAWESVDAPDSGLYKLLKSDMFKNTKETGDEINSDVLRIFALLHCAANANERAVRFYGILQEGGAEKH